ncbi:MULTISPECIES: bacteriocin [Chryseobacterium]|uniref:Bacteriocin n=1 Tax=Chryseobacterium gallinarum TaxID=1324352 RepID=A0ABX6KM10_CHRGL|nr:MULTISPECIES: bacteriocin [Chryseobacterium]MCL8538346.1 bacteriocin [Chryseobacterium gallinarum]QIY89687.1 bacteriocin [Chryseobacterium gallinarum]
MKNQNLNKGKKLNKKELKVITGGLRLCVDPSTGFCTEISDACAERRCRLIVGPILD